MIKVFLKSTFLFYLLFFLGVELIVSVDWISAALLPRPSQVFLLFINQSELIFKAFAETAWVSFLSYILASSFAFLLALVLHFFPGLQKKIMPLTLFFQTLPIIAIAPLLVIYLGFGLPSVFAASLIVCFFPVFAATLVGLNQVEKNQAELFSFLKAKPLQKLFYLEIPSSLPTILAGLKTAAGLSVVGVVSGEFISGGGLGALIDSSRLQQRVDLVFAALICLSVIGLVLMRTTESFFRLLFKAYLFKI